MTNEPTLLCQSMSRMKGGEPTHPWGAGPSIEKGSTPLHDNKLNNIMFLYLYPAPKPGTDIALIKYEMASSSIKNQSSPGLLKRLMDNITGNTTAQSVVPYASHSVGGMARQSRSIDRFEMAGNTGRGVTETGKKIGPDGLDSYRLAFLDQVRKSS